jgi:hypothetical protein
MIEFDNILRKWTSLIPLTLHDSKKTKPWNNLTESVRFIHWIPMHKNQKRLINLKSEHEKLLTLSLLMNPMLIIVSIQV